MDETALAFRNKFVVMSESYRGDFHSGRQPFHYARMAQRLVEVYCGPCNCGLLLLLLLEFMGWPSGMVVTVTVKG